MNVEEEVGRLREEIKRLGTLQSDALVGTLRAAKKRKVLTYDGELLLQGVHDNVEITLNPTPAAAN
ncbi:hypothetical protein Ahy_B10g101198 isoform C [Arachis hypogaea]|uniref:Costars domain-containing protein n=1 Tax=Arachis hypogaea TaxID=3818 RepID=A0A444WYT8_ARAHY|nr:hypothetical protein Ahy_B10g101198 isoform C [Arachis hypogaea]